MNIGPHVVRYVGPDDKEHEIELHFELGLPAPLLPSHPDFDPGKKGIVHIKSEIINQSLYVYGEDDIQVAWRLMRLSGVALIKWCADDGVELYKYLEGDVAEWPDLFS